MGNTVIIGFGITINLRFFLEKRAIYYIFNDKDEMSTRPNQNNKNILHIYDNSQYIVNILIYLSIYMILNLKLINESKYIKNKGYNENQFFFINLFDLGGFIEKGNYL